MTSTNTTYIDVLTSQLYSYSEQEDCECFRWFCFLEGAFQADSVVVMR